MTTVRFIRGAAGATVFFRFDARLVDVVKSVPAGARSWNKATKTWWVADPYAEWLVDDMRHLGYSVITGADDQRRQQRADRGGAWAQMLFDRVGPDRAAAVHRALSRVLHPDVGGDTELMQELNDARRGLA